MKERRNKGMMVVRCEWEGGDGGDDEIFEIESDCFIVKVVEYL